MKKLSALWIVSAAISLLTSFQGLADFKSSTTDGVITCAGKGFTVVINKERSEFTVAQTREPVVFVVQDEPETNQHSFVSYIGALQLNHQRDLATVTLSNLGDTLEIGGKTRSMRCP